MAGINWTWLAPEWALDVDIALSGRCAVDFAGTSGVAFF
jgi:hypothetical protein